MKTIYLIGARRKSEKNQTNFTKAENLLFAKSFRVLNPYRYFNNLDEIEATRKCLNMLINNMVSIVVALPKWNECKYANIEMAIARNLGCDIWFYEDNKIIKGKPFIHISNYHKDTYK